MSRVRLATRLALLAATLVVAAAGGVGLAAMSLVRRYAEEQALARVSLASHAAVEQVEQAVEETEKAARLLSERPTLARLVESRDRRGLAGFLERFRATGGWSSCAVAAGGEVLAAAAGVGEGEEGRGWVGKESVEGEGAVLLVGAAGAAEPAILATASLGGSAPGARVAVVRFLDDAFAAGVSERVGLAVAIHPAPSPPTGRWDPGPAPDATAPSEASILCAPPAASAEKDPVAGLFRSTQLLPSAAGRQAPAGAGAVAVTVTLPMALVEAEVRRLALGLALLTSLIAAAATAAAVGLGRTVARPLAGLAAAARRIGRGDLATPVAAAEGAEVGALAATMEEMRVRLLGLTAELRRSESEAQALLEGIVEGVFAVDGDRRLTYLNPQAAQLLGVTPEAALGRFCGDVLRPREAAGGRPCEERCPIVHARSRGRSRAVEHLVATDGRRRTVVVTASEPAEGRQVQVLRDETDVEAAGRARDAVLAHVSHEFKTPLAAQIASLELLTDGGAELEPAARAELLGSLERSARRLTRLVDNLLESVRLEAGVEGIRRQPVDLEATLAEAVAQTAPLLARRGQKVSTRDVRRPLPAVAGDGPRLVQVFVNLLANAGKFAPADSTIDLGAEAETEGAVRLWVEDRGPGLPEAGGRSIFDRFYRAPGGEPDAAGIGLGLWIVKSIVERHGGSVEAASRPEGGSRFTVVLPREEVPG